MEMSIKNRDFASFAHLTCADSNQFHAVCLDTCPPIFYMNDTSHRQVLICGLTWNISGCKYLFLFWLQYQTVHINVNVMTRRIISCVEKWNRSEGTPQVCLLLSSYFCRINHNFRREIIKKKVRKVFEIQKYLQK